MTENSKIENYGGKDLILSKNGSQICVTIRMCDWDERDKEFKDKNKSRIQFYDENQVRTSWGAWRLDIPWGKVSENGEIGVYPPNKWDAQKFRIQKIGDFYKILWEDYALTFESETGKIFMSKSEDNDGQLWSFKKFVPSGS